ncbi:alpha-hydroxy-acid oxidizing protein [Micromonospora pattaloongensis]|uniref:alpha-hydroxy-acid oxidizing protein n=1 Tax=Micromonospora pattaloongensis TaxID=405436 RepID=UPI001C312535
MSEHAVRANRAAFAQATIVPRVLTGVTEPDQRVDVLGQRWPVPIVVAPMATTGWSIRRASRPPPGPPARGVPFRVSTMTCRTDSSPRRRRPVAQIAGRKGAP